MPIYVYRCQACAHIFEELVLSRANEDSVTCPACHSTELARLQAAFATTSGGYDSAPTCGQGACSSCAYNN